jgi:Glycosyltransferase family 87
MDRRPLNPLIVVGSVGAWILVVAYFAAHGRVDAHAHADFVNVWSAGRLVLQGDAVRIFDPRQFFAAQQAMFDPAVAFHFWSYPPTALFFVAPLGLFDYFTAFTVWSVAGLIVLALAGWTFLGDRRDLGLLLLSPAVAVNLGLGQNGFLTGAMLLAGTALMDRRPIAGGALFGLLSFKAHLGVLVPVALLARRQWRLLAISAVTAIALVALSAAVFGIFTWRAFFALTVPAQTRAMSEGTGSFLWLMPTAFVSGRLLGLSAPSALAVQAPFAAVSAWLVWRAYRRDGDPSTRAAMLMVATFLATPLGFNYDMIPVAAATLVLARSTRSVRDRFLCGMVWIVPVAVMPFNAVRLPIMPLALLLMAVRLDRLHAASTSFLSVRKTP